MKYHSLFWSAIFMALMGLSPNEVYAQSQRIICDETCKLADAPPAAAKTVSAKPAASATAKVAPAATKQPAKPAEPVVQPEKVEPGFSVVSPIGRSAVPLIEQAPRLTSLSGKTIAVVGTNFMARITHPEIKRLILENYPDAKVILQDEIGVAGLYPAPGLHRPAKDEFQRKLKQMGVDAVISGNGGCGLCTPKETGNCIAAEYVGVPSVIIAGPGFINQAKYTALNNGVAVMRCAEYPGAFALHTEEELIRNTREVLWPQIVEALTKPITAQEREEGAKGQRGDIRDDVFYGTLDEIQAYFQEMNWTDGMPVIPPTFEKVEEFMKYSPVAWDETVVVLPPANRDVKAWHVAVNAVMAGCKKEYMPILVAMAKGMGVNKFYRTLSSTHGWMPFCWLNGPLARQLGIDCGQGQINEAANVAIGRFMNLAMMNLCGYYIKEGRMGTFGYPMSWCLVEDEEACKRVGWNPFHVRAGYAMNDNTITLSSALLWGNNMTPATTDPQKLTELLAWDITERGQFALGSGNQFSHRTILMTEPVAAVFAKKYRSPERLEDALIDLARKPVRERVFAKYYAAPGSAKENSGHTIKEYSGYIRKTEGAEKTPTLVWYDSPESELLTIPVMKEGMTDILITGDAARNKIQTMPGAGLGGGHATIEIQLPNNWDALMAELGYEPLEAFKLNGVSTRDEEKIQTNQGNAQRRKPEHGRPSDGYSGRSQNGNDGMGRYHSTEHYIGGYRQGNVEYRQDRYFVPQNEIN